MSETAKRSDWNTPQGYHPNKPEILNAAQNAIENDIIGKTRTVKAAYGGKYIDGVPVLQWGEWKDNTYCGCIAAAMELMGQPVGYSMVMGATGLCFRFGMSEDWDPGVSLAQQGPLATDDSGLSAALGIAMNWTSDPKERERRLRQEIDAGRPVLCLGQNGPPEWGLLLGYTANGEIFGRSYFDQQERGQHPDGVCEYTQNHYLKAYTYPGFVPEYFVRFIDKACTTTDAKEVLKNSLLFCTSSFDTTWEKFKIGEGAYRIFIRGMQLDNDDYRKHCGNDQYFLGGLLDAGRAAQQYLRDSAALLTGENRQQLISISAWYEKMNREILRVIPYEKTTAIFSQSSAPIWDRALRLRLAGVLQENLECEKKIRAAVKTILKHWAD